MSKDLQNITPNLSTSSLAAYVHWVNQIPLLTAEEEKELAYRLKENGDLEAAKRLVMAHLRFVVKMARGYNGYGLPVADLIQEGNIGLMKAVKRFDPDKGVRLVSFAVHWIRSEIHEFVIKNWRIVKIATTKAQRKLFFNLRRSAKKLSWFSSQEITAISEQLAVPEKDVKQMEARLANYDQAFDTSEYEDETSSPAHYLEDKRFNPETLVENSDTEAKQTTALYAALAELDERSQEILKNRWLSDKKYTLHDLAARYDVSAERIRQLEKSAMLKLKEKIAA